MREAVRGPGRALLLPGSLGFLGILYHNLIMAGDCTSLALVFLLSLCIPALWVFVYHLFVIFYSGSFVIPSDICIYGCALLR